MRKSQFLILLLGLVITLFTLGKGDTYAACGGSWWNTSCADTPYCKDSKDCNIDKGREATEGAIGGMITKKPISEYAQQIVSYLMTFISIIAIIYIIYAGFQLMIGAGDEEKMKKTRQIIVYVIVGILVMWLAYPIVKWTVELVRYSGSLIPQAMAEYTESDNDTFADYKNRIKEAVNQMEGELIMNKSVSLSTIQNVKNLVQLGYDRLPDRGEAGTINKESKQFVDTYLTLASQNPTNGNHIGNAMSRVEGFLDKANISRITGDISAGPAEGNSPLSVSFRAENVKDPSGTTPDANNYIWWTRENGGYRRELSRGPSLSYTFTKEGTYTVFLDVVSGSRNSKGKIDVLPLSVSKQITVKPKLGEIILLINGVNVSNMDKIKISPAVGKMGIILDASASRAIGNGTIAETTWEFGNGETSTNKGAPIVERQIYANPSGYIVKLSIKTNDGQVFKKEIQLLVIDPSATIKLDKDTGHIGEDISMSATSYLSDTKNTEYSWEIQDESGNKVVKVGEGVNFKHKFEKVGSYIISLTSKSANGSVDKDSKIFTVESREPMVTIDSPKPLKSERPNTIIFDASKSYDPDSNSKKNLTYTWKIDGMAVTLDNIENEGAKGTYTFDSKGNHKVSVTVANPYGKITTAESSFEVSSTLSVNLITTPKVAKRNEAVSVIAQSSNAEFFEWNMGDGSPTISGNNRSVQYVYKKSGTYTINLTVTRDNGNETNSINRKIYVTDTDSPFSIIETTNSSNSILEEAEACGSNPATIVSRSDTTTFNGSNSVNIDGSNGELSYTWKYFGKVRTTSSISEKFNELGCFPIELTVRSNKNGASHTTVKYIKLANQPPEITSLSTTVDSAKKDSQKIIVNVKANGAIDPDGVITSYIWYYTTDSDPEPQNVQITQKDQITFVLPNITEKYYFGLILEDNDGAKFNTAESGKGRSPLTIDNSNGNIYLPLITLTTPKTTINVGEKAHFSTEVKTIIPGVNITNKVEYAWDFDGDGRIDERKSTPSVDHVYTKSGDFNVKVRVTNNGVSNTKYQTIHVKNPLKASVSGYKLPDGRIYLLNTSEGSYDKAEWTAGDTTSESLTSLLVSDSSGATTGKLTVSNSSNDTSTTDIDFSKLETITGSGVLYQSYPKSTNDVITVKNPGDAILISMFGNDAQNYSIDTDTLIDTNLDGVTDNDSDNKDDTSYTDGSVYAIYNLGNTGKREHTIRLALVQNGIVKATRNITIILDYIANAEEQGIDINGTGASGLSTGDREKIEKLSKMIREITTTDRGKLTQQYNILVENWNNTFEKTKSLIDIQESVEASSITEEKKKEMTKVIDELLVGDAEATNEISIAAIVIRDLIPQESTNHDAIIAKLAEIESHPTLLDANRKLGEEMLAMIEKDPTIPDKYKLHIRNQLDIIVNGGSVNTPTEGSGSTVKTETTSEGGILGFISGFVKIFFIIVGVIIGIGILAFGFYRFTRKGDTVGFQDFLIDSVFHSKQTPPASPSTKESSTVVNGPPPLPKEDPLSSYTPITPLPVAPTQPVDIPLFREQKRDPLASIPIVEPATSNTLESGENIPDWLKAPVANSILEAPSTEITPIESSSYTTPAQTKSESPQESPTPISTKDTEDSIPDWIKNTPIDTKDTGANTAPLGSTPINPLEEEKLPDWLLNSLQSEESTSIGGSTDASRKDEDISTGVDISNNSFESATESDDTGDVPEKPPVAKKKTKKAKAEAPKDDNTGVVSGADTSSLPDWLK